MKKLLFWMVLIVGIVVLIGSCKTDEESTTATTSCGGDSTKTIASSCSGTASGSITGIDNASLSGTFSPFHLYGIAGGYSVDNSTDCIDNSTIIASWANTFGYPTGSTSAIVNYFVTSSSTFAKRHIFYSDSGCSTELASVVFGYDELSNGGRASGLDTSEGPSTASKLTYNLSCAKFKGSTAAGVTWIKTLLNGTDPTVGTEYTCDVGTNARYALMFVDNSSSQAQAWGNVVYFEESETAVPSDWDDPDTMYTLP